MIVIEYVKTVKESYYSDKSAKSNFVFNLSTGACTKSTNMKRLVQGIPGFCSFLSQGKLLDNLLIFSDIIYRLDYLFITQIVIMYKVVMEISTFF